MTGAPRHRATSWCLLLAASFLGSLGTAGCRSANQGSATVELLARAPERGNWSPQTIRVRRGTAVTLVIRNVDVVTHGFYLPALELHVAQINAGDVARVSFTPQVAGTYPFYCSVWCGDYHMQMRGTLIVE